MPPRARRILRKVRLPDRRPRDHGAEDDPTGNWMAAAIQLALEEPDGEFPCHRMFEQAGLMIVVAGYACPICPVLCRLPEFVASLVPKFVEDCVGSLASIEPGRLGCLSVGGAFVVSWVPPPDHYARGMLFGLCFPHWIGPFRSDGRLRGETGCDRLQRQGRTSDPLWDAARVLEEKRELERPPPQDCYEVVYLAIRSGTTSPEPDWIRKLPRNDHTMAERKRALRRLYRNDIRTCFSYVIDDGSCTVGKYGTYRSTVIFKGSRSRWQASLAEMSLTKSVADDVPFVIDHALAELLFTGFIP